MQEAPDTDSSSAVQPKASNPWVQASTSLGVTALVVGVLVALLGGPNGYADDAGPAAVRLVIAASLSVVGFGLLLSALVIVGVGWNLRNLPAK